VVGATTDRTTGLRPQLVFTKQIARAIVVNSTVYLRHTCSCRTACRKSIFSRRQPHKFAIY